MGAVMSMIEWYSADCWYIMEVIILMIGGTVIYGRKIKSVIFWKGYNWK